MVAAVEDMPAGEAAVVEEDPDARHHQQQQRARRKGCVRNLKEMSSTSDREHPLIF